MQPGAQPLQADEVHVWWLDPQVVTKAANHAACWEVLSAVERARHARLRVDGARLQHVAAHALLRLTLSRYAAVAPQQWEFETNRYGRPEIAAPTAVPPLRFNLSHTRGLVVCGVTLQRDLGVDVEELRDTSRQLDIARRFFAPAEAAALAATPPDAQNVRFFEYWTLKESYIKARGLGLSLPLRRFAFDLTDRSQVRVSFDPELQDDAAHWHFTLARPTTAHVLAVATRRRPGIPIRVQIKRADFALEEAL